jgi:hypothetical protein
MSRPQTTNDALLEAITRLDTKVDRLESSSYSREMVDSKLSQVTDDIRGLRDELRNLLAKQQQGWQNIWVKIGIAVSAGYIILQALPHLSKAFGG